MPQKFTFPAMLMASFFVLCYVVLCKHLWYLEDFSTKIKMTFLVFSDNYRMDHHETCCRYRRWPEDKLTTPKICPFFNILHL